MPSGWDTFLLPRVTDDHLSTMTSHDWSVLLGVRVSPEPCGPRAPVFTRLWFSAERVGVSPLSHGPGSKWDRLTHLFPLWGQTRRGGRPQTGGLSIRAKFES